ncbi:MAG: ATP-binding protein [Planctomycetota bacterium]|nr:ATP-binding protein [Planctomycetota bacterium]
MNRVNRFWNLRVKLVALLGCLLAGTLAAQAWLHGASERKLLTAIEEVAGEIATEAVEMMMKATAQIPTQPTRVSITFTTNNLLAGNKQLVPDEQSGKMLRKMQQALHYGSISGSSDQIDDALLQSPLNDLVRAMISKNFPDVDVQEALAFAQQEQNQSADPSFYSFRDQGKTDVPLEDSSLKSEVQNPLGNTLAQLEELAELPLPEADDDVVASDSVGSSLALMEKTKRITAKENERSRSQLGVSTSSDKSADVAKSSPAGKRKVHVHVPIPRYGNRQTRSQEKKVASPATQIFGTTGADRQDALASGIDLQPHLDRLQLIGREARKRDLQATVGVFLLGVVLAWLLGTRLVRPVTEVVDGMRRVASGDLAMRLPERDDPEFGLVSHQFNDMVERLEDARRIERGLEHRERVQTMGDLAAGVAHDIRNPLSAISLHVGRIRREFEPESPEARKKFLNYTGDVKQEIERLNGLVTNFLQLAQPSSHEVESVAPGGLLEDVHRLLEKEAAAHQVSLEVEVQDNLCEARWNQIEAKSAFLNVAMNAIQAMDGIGGSLRMTARSDQQWVVISFIDDGPGIPEQDQEKVLLPYVTMRPGGTGLGLAIARRVAERHGGRLELGSAVGVGTEVRFVMPIDDGEAS